MTLTRAGIPNLMKKGLKVVGKKKKAKKGRKRRLYRKATSS